MSSYRAEMLLLREALESVVPPEVATALMFDALELSSRPPPRSLEETRAFADEALAEAIRRKVAPEQVSQILRSLDEGFARASAGDAGALDDEDVAIDVDIDEEAWGAPDPTATAQMAVVQKPVPVVVLGAGASFAEKLVACLGDDRVRTVAVTDETAFRKAVFAYAPLIVLVDATSPPSLDPQALTALLRGVPVSAMPVLWGAESGWARAVIASVEDAGVRLVTLSRAEGIEPLLDLVLARFRGDG